MKSFIQEIKGERKDAKHDLNLAVANHNWTSAAKAEQVDEILEYVVDRLERLLD